MSKEEEKKTLNDVFDNPMVRQAMKAMTVEQREEYRRIGEYMFNDAFRMKEDKFLTKDDTKMEDAFKYVDVAIRSGLDPLELTQMELQVLHDMLGDEWYKHYDFREDEVAKLAFSLSRTPYIRGKQREDRRRKKKEEKKNKKKAGMNPKKL